VSARVAGFFEHFDPRADVLAVVVEGAAADHVSVDHAGLVDERPAADFEVELALWDRRHPAAFDAIGGGRDFDAVADAGNRHVLSEEVFRHSHEVFVVADVLGSSSAGEEDAGVVFLFDFGEGDVGIDRVALPLFGNRPARFHFVQNHLVLTFLGSGDDGLKAGFDQSVVRIHRVERFRCVADDDENFVAGHRVAFLFEAGETVVRSRCRRC